MTNETVTTPDDETVATPVESTPQTESRSGGGGLVLAALVGGFLAGGVGYVAGYYTDFGLFRQADAENPIGAISLSLEEQASRLASLETQLSETPEDDPARAELQDTLSAVNDQVAMLSGRLEQIEAAATGEAPLPEPVDLTPLSDRLTGVESQLESLRQQSDSQAAQLSDTSASDAASEQIGQQAEDLAAQSEQIAALQSRIEELAGQVQTQAQTIDEQSQAIQEAEQAATAKANTLAASGAYAAIGAALDAGEPYAGPLGQYETATGDAAPEALAASAEDGVASLRELQQSFDEPSRAALSESVGETAGDGVASRLGAFIRSQTNARSLSEQEGDGADAILSRAQARLNEGDLQAALDEIAALPQSGQEALSDWTARAQARLDAMDAYSGLPTPTNSN